MNEVKIYSLYWSVYLQWRKPFTSDEEALKEAKKVLPTDADGWKLIREEVIAKG